MEPKKYYWLKLKKDFFKRHDIRIIEAMPNGKDYVLFYLKLLVESLDHDGKLRFSNTIPYSESMLATITNTNVDIVRSAIKIFAELQMMQLLDDGTLFLLQVELLTGSETTYAEKKRIYRRSKNLQIEDNSKTKKDIVRQEIRDKRIEKDIHSRAKKTTKHKRGQFQNVLLTDEEYARLSEKYQTDLPDMISHLSEYIKRTGKAASQDHNLVLQKWVLSAVLRERQEGKSNHTSIENLPDLPPELAEELTNGRK